MNKNTPQASVGQKIRYYREKCNLTQAQLAEKAKVRATTISNYETDYSIPKMKMLYTLADIFDISVKYLLDDSPDSFSPEEKIAQSGYHKNSIPYFTHKNTAGLCTRDIKIADSYMSLPSVRKYNTDRLYTTSMPDSSMINSGIHQDAVLVVNPDRKIVTGNTVVLIDNQNNQLLVRMAVTDGPIVNYIGSSNSDIPQICSYINDKNYTYIGTVVAVLSKLKIYDD